MPVRTASVMGAPYAWCEAVPAGPDDLDPRTMTEALRGVTGWAGARVSSLDWEQVARDRRGFTGLLARVRVGYDPPGAGPPSVMAKFPLFRSDAAERRQTGSNPTGMSRSRMAQALREMWFYETVARALPDQLPQCWAAAADPAEGRLVLLLEDVADARPGDDLLGCSAADAGAVLTAAAAMHAAWWGTTTGFRRSLPGWATAAGASAARNATGRACDASPTVVSRCHRTSIGSPTRCARPWRSCSNASTGRRMPSSTAPFTSTTCCSPAAARPVTLLDWRGACRGPAVLDTAFIASSLDPSDRRRHEDDLLRDYTAALARDGVARQDLEQVRGYYPFALLVRFADTLEWLAGHGDRDALTARQAALVDAVTGEGRLTTALLDHNADALAVAL